MLPTEGQWSDHHHPYHRHRIREEDHTTAAVNDEDNEEGEEEVRKRKKVMQEKFQAYCEKYRNINQEDATVNDSKSSHLHTNPSNYLPVLSTSPHALADVAPSETMVASNLPMSSIFPVPVVNASQFPVAQQNANHDSTHIHQQDIPPVTNRTIISDAELLSKIWKTLGRFMNRFRVSMNSDFRFITDNHEVMNLLLKKFYDALVLYNGHVGHFNLDDQHLQLYLDQVLITTLRDYVDNLLYSS